VSSPSDPVLRRQLRDAKIAVEKAEKALQDNKHFKRVLYRRMEGFPGLERLSVLEPSARKEVEDLVVEVAITRAIYEKLLEKAQ
jgi:hypothetical protein